MLSQTASVETMCGRNKSVLVTTSLLSQHHYYLVSLYLCWKSVNRTADYNLSLAGAVGITPSQQVVSGFWLLKGRLQRIPKTVK